MKKSLIKQYLPVLLLFGFELLLSLFLPETGTEAFNISFSYLLQMLSFLPPVFILLGLLDVWVEREKMIALTGKGSGFKGMVISFLLGSAAAGPLYAAFPVAAVMAKKGSSLFNILVFLGAWSSTKIPLLSFEAASLGAKFMLLRLGLNLFGILIIAFLSARLSEK